MNKVYVDKARLLRRAIVISWITLALCFVVKIFGGNFFEIMCNNQNYKALCEYADTHFWCKYLLCFASSMVCEILFLLAIFQKYNLSIKEWCVSTISVIIACFIKLLLPKFGLLSDVWITILLPIVFIGKPSKKYFAVLFANLFNWGFQFISLLVKNLSIGIIDNSTFISLIYMIDLYLMCFLYYLYRNYQKESIKMGAFWSWFAGKPVDKLKEMKVKREKQIEKLNEEIKAIEKAIKEQSDK